MIFQQASLSIKFFDCPHSDANIGFICNYWSHGLHLTLRCKLLSQGVLIALHGIGLARACLAIDKNS